MKVVRSIRQVRSLVLLCLVLLLIQACSPYRTIELDGGVEGETGSFPEKVKEGASVELHLVSGEIAYGIYRGCHGDSILLAPSPRRGWTRESERRAAQAHCVKDVEYIYEVRTHNHWGEFGSGVLVAFLLTLGIAALSVPGR